MLGPGHHCVTRWRVMAMADRFLERHFASVLPCTNLALTFGMVDAQMLLGALAALAVAGVAAGSLYARQYLAGRKQASKDDAEEEPRRDLRRKRGCSTPLPCHAALMLRMRNHKLYDVLVTVLHLYNLHA